MGLVAREHGFSGPLERLFIPEVNLLYGCLHLARFWERYGNLEDVVASYNAGSPRRGPDGKYVNWAYVARVMEVLKLEVLKMSNGILPATIVGSVVDIQTLVGIDGAAVSIIEEPARGTIYTIEGGSFFFQGIRRSYLTLRTSANGYLPKDQRVNIPQGSTFVSTVVFLTRA